MRRITEDPHQKSLSSMMFAEEVLLGCIGTTTDVSAVSDHTWFAESVSNVNYKVFATTDATSWLDLLYCNIVPSYRQRSSSSSFEIQQQILSRMLGTKWENLAGNPLNLRRQWTQRCLRYSAAQYSTVAVAQYSFSTLLPPFFWQCSRLLIIP